MKRNIVHYVTRQYMQQNRKRTWVTFLGIVFMVLLMTCVFVGKDTAVGYLEDVATQKDGKWHVALYDITEEQRDEVLALQGIKETAASIDYGVTEFAESVNAGRPYLNVKAYQQQCFDWMNIKVKDGRLPEQSGEIVISEAVLTDGATIGIGTTITAEYFKRSLKGINPELSSSYFPFQNLTVEYGKTVEVPLSFPYYGDNDSFEEIRDYTGKKQEYKIVGIIEVPGFEESSAAGYTAITALTDVELAGVENFNLSVLLDLRKTKINDIEYYRSFDSIAEGRVEFNDYVLAFSGSSSESTNNVLVFFLSVFFVGLIMFVSVILIYNVFNISYEERSWYLGMLSSVGATGKQKRSSIYYEAFYLLLFALPVGILAGLLVVKLGMMGIQTFLDQLMNIEQQIVVGTGSISLYVSGNALTGIVILSMVTVLISSFLPARKVGKIGPIECIRGNTIRKNRQYQMKRTLLKKGNAEKMLAGNTIKRQAKKTRAITAAAVSFLVILGVTAFGANAITKAVDIKINHSSDMEINNKKWDYLFAVNSVGDAEYEVVKQEIMEAEGIADTAEWYDGMFVGNVPLECLSEEYQNAVGEIYGLYGISEEEFQDKKPEEVVQVCMIVMDSKSLKELAGLTGSDWDRLSSEEIPGAIVVQCGELSTEKVGFADRKPEHSRYYEIGCMTNKKVGEEMPVSIYSEEAGDVVEFPVQVAGYANAEQLEDYVSIHSQFLWLIVSRDTAQKMNKVMGENSALSGTELLIRVAEEEEYPEILEKLSRFNDDYNGKYYLLFLGISDTINAAVTGTVNVLLTCFVILASVICLFNLFNSIQGRNNERSREFATLESIGMTGAQIGKMLLYECFGIVLKSIIYAVVIAGFLCYLIQYGIVEIFGPLQIGFPWLLMTGAVVVTVLVVTGLTEYCYRRRKPETILERIRRESV